MAFEDLAYAQEFRDIIFEMVRQEVDRIRPDSQIGEVTSIDGPNNKCFVKFPGVDETAVPVRMYTIRPSTVGVSVRVEGKPGLKYVAEVVSGGAAISAVSTGFVPSNYKLSDFAAPTVAVSMGSQRLTNLATPTSTADAATKGYVDTKADSGHTHDLAGSTIVGVLPASKLSTDVFSTSNFPDTNQVTGLAALLDAKASAVHTHSAADIVTGNFPISVLPVATSGTSSSSQVVRADDSRLSNARTPTAHTHTKSQITDFAHTHVAADVTGTFTIGQLPVAASGSSSTTQLVRADDVRLSNSRTPSAHNHPISDITSLQIELDERPVIHHPSPTPPLSSSDGDYWIDTTNDPAPDIVVTTDAGTFTHTGNLLTGVVESDEGQTQRTMTITYNGRMIDSVTEVAFGQTVTTTFAYTDEIITGYTRSQS